jgi:glycosyltransferase involved in cell wall biosynthesis
MWLWQLSPLILPLLRRVPVVLQAATYKEICPTGLKLLPDGRECRDRAGRVCLRAGCVAVPTWLSTMLQLALVRRWRGAIDLPTALSARMTEVFAAAGWPGLTVLPNGVDAAAMRPPLAGPPRAAYAGRLSREKGVETLLDAFARIAGELPQARLMIAGTGPLEAALKARAAPLGARVAFLGHLPRPQMEAKFATAWVQVVPSLWHEPFGNVSTEAMMRGTAVIAADVGGQSDIVRDGRTGALVPPGDPAALAAALARYLGDRALAEAQGRAGRAVALAEYSRERNTAMVVEAYRTAIARFAAGARGRGA